MAVHHKAKTDSATQSAVMAPRVAATGTPAKAAAPKAPAADDEIEQIMSEIEELQQEMGEGTAPEAAADPAPQEAGDILDEFRAGGGSETSMEETLGSLQEEEGNPSGPNLIDQALEASQEEETAVAEAEAEAEAPADEEPVAEEEEHSQGEVIPMSPRHAQKNTPAADSPSTEQGSLTLTLSGNMTLSLNYECDGQSVTLGFHDHCLIIQLADGSEFKIPVRRAA
jgi:hypothetical protein